MTHPPQTCTSISTYTDFYTTYTLHYTTQYMSWNKAGSSFLPLYNHFAWTMKWLGQLNKLVDQIL